MNSLSLLNKIFGPKENLTRQEIDDYKDNKGDIHDVELKASASQLNQDALEGWEDSAFTVEEGMKEIDQKIEHFLNTTAPKSLFNRPSMIWGAALFSVAVFVFILFTYQGNQEFKNKIENTTVVAENSETKNEIEDYIQLADNKIITSEILKEKDNYQKVEEEEETTLNLEVERFVLDEKVSAPVKENENSKNLELPVHTGKSVPTARKEDLQYQIAKEVYLHNLKNVDYRAYRDRPFEVPEISVGVPANAARAKQNNSLMDEDSFETQEVTYIDYLDESARLFDLGQYKTALSRYLVILDNYPNDVNANFYGGLCYFNLSQFELAIELLEKSYTIGYGNFREEAMWFTAQAYYELDNKIQTRYYLKKIIKEDGFYAERAKELLIELK